MAGVGRPTKEKRQARRKHSFGGCRTCRRRHVKCDQVRPSCLACRAVNAVCEGYATHVRWMPPSTLSSANGGRPDQDENDQDTTRYHLYSEASRASMSSALVRNFDARSVDASLAEIDERTKDSQDLEDADFAVGSFGVFTVAASSRITRLPGPNPLSHAPAHITPVAASINYQIPAQDIDIGPNDDTANASMSVDNATLFEEPLSVPSVVDWFDPILGFDSTLHWADLFGLDFDEGNSLLVPQQPPAFEPAFSFSSQQINQEFLQQNLQEPVHPSSDAPPPYAGPDQTLDQESNAGKVQEEQAIVLAEVKSTEEAQYLLRHFNTYVIPQMSFMPSKTKSPWTIMQLPEAVRSLADLTYMHSGTLKHANAANFYGLLACSAYHLATSASLRSMESQNYWEHLFDRLKARAKTHMQISLREELKGPRKAKYKDQLMAILSLLALTSISGNQRDARCYMIDAERLLRVKGLAKREISRKCRLLHHVYSWVRIVGESTYVIHDYRSYGSVVDNMSTAHRAGRLHGNREKRARDTRSRGENNPRLDDFLRLEPHSSDSDLDIEEIKEHEGGLHDIHLVDSRQFHGTMYHIYGISETWLSLVSQTTRLANILDASRYAQKADVNFHDFLQKRAGRLENIICSFALKDPASEDEDETMSAIAERPSNHSMLRAMNSALVILFYRRIRNVNPLILQGHVDTVVQSLKEFDVALATEELEGPGSAWPAFIAGCEALSRRNRKFLMSWLDKGFSKCGLQYFGVSRQVMKEVWERQDEPTPLLDPGSGSSSQSRPQKSSSYHRSWVDISREKNQWVILF